MPRTTVTDRETGEPIGWADLSKAVETHETRSHWDGSNHVATHGGTYRQQTLYLTKSGAWIVYDKAAGLSGTSWAGSQDSCYRITEDEARDWLLANDQPDHPLCETAEV